MRYVVILFLLLSILYSQEPEGWIVPFACAFHPDVSGFNRKFAEHNLPETKIRHYGWGLELRSLVDRNFLVGPMLFRTWDDTQNEVLHIRGQTFGIFGEAGLKLSIFKFLVLIPEMGIGGVQSSFSIRKKSGDVNLDSILKEPGQEVNFSCGMKLTAFGAIEIDLLIPTNTGSYGIGIRGGYIYSPFTLQWHLTNGAHITGAPNSLIRGPWVSLGVTIIPAPEISRE